MIDWKFVKPDGLPIEAYAPAVMEFQGACYYTACNIGLYRTNDPKGGKWEYIGKPFDVGDPDLFVDDDGRVYLLRAFLQRRHFGDGTRPEEPVPVRPIGFR
jgi:beta-xylosidase